MPSAESKPPIPLRIAATGAFLPEQVVPSSVIDARTSMVAGWTEKHTGVRERRHVKDETTAGMAAAALQDALSQVTWRGAPDVLISAGGTPHQPIPNTSSLVARMMGWSGLACLDVNATCLGFVAALQLAAGLLATTDHERLAIVCSESGSKGLNWSEPESAGLIGDGAAAVLLERDRTGESCLLEARLETWPEGAEFTEIRGGGTALPATHYEKAVNTDDFLFHMDGPAVYRLAAQKLPVFVKTLVGESEDRWNEVDWVVPHQASLPALKHLSRRLSIPESKLIVTLETHGNVIAASMPLALHYGIQAGMIERRQKLMFLGTSAGFSVGGALLVY